jgi:hypothetical protein
VCDEERKLSKNAHYHPTGGSGTPWIFFKTELERADTPKEKHLAAKSFLTPFASLFNISLSNRQWQLPKIVAVQSSFAPSAAMTSWALNHSKSCQGKMCQGSTSDEQEQWHPPPWPNVQFGEKN